VIKLFNLKKRTEAGELHEHKGTITALRFYKSQYLLSGSEDGTIIIWRSKDWSLMHILRHKKAAVEDIVIHPSGKLAIAIYRN